MKINTRRHRRTQTDIPYTCVEALVREALLRHVSDGSRPYRLQAAGAAALHRACEAYLVALFEGGDKVQDASGHSMLHAKHLLCARECMHGVSAKTVTVGPTTAFPLQRSTTAGHDIAP